MKCSVKQRGKFFIVVDPFHHKSYTLNNRLGAESLAVTLNKLHNDNKQLKGLIKKTLETTPIEHTLAVELKNSVREFYD